MSAVPSAYLVLGSQRSGSTLLVESLRATGVAGEPQEFFQYLPDTSQAPQPRQWFDGVEDQSILRSRTAPPISPPRRSGVTTSAPWAAHPTGCGAAS